MEIKEIKPLLVFYKSVKTSLLEINNYVKTTPAEMMKEAKNLGIEITGPQIWCYHYLENNSTSEFILEISFPVKEKIENQEDQFKLLHSFKCMSTIHKGTWSNLKDTYENIFKEIYSSNKQFTQKTREVYINIDFENSENNITEIQIGIN